MDYWCGPCGTCHGEGEIERQLNPNRTRVELCPECNGDLPELDADTP